MSAAGPRRLRRSTAAEYEAHELRHVYAITNTYSHEWMIERDGELWSILETLADCERAIFESEGFAPPPTMGELYR